jgi:hypothetical protein
VKITNSLEVGESIEPILTTDSYFWVCRPKGVTIKTVYQSPHTSDHDLNSRPRDLYVVKAEFRNVFEGDVIEISDEHISKRKYLHVKFRVNPFEEEGIPTEDNGGANEGESSGHGGEVSDSILYSLNFPKNLGAEGLLNNSK